MVLLVTVSGFVFAQIVWIMIAIEYRKKWIQAKRDLEKSDEQEQRFADRCDAVQRRNRVLADRLERLCNGIREAMGDDQR